MGLREPSWQEGTGLGAPALADMPNNVARSVRVMTVFVSARIPNGRILKLVARPAYWY